MALTQISSGGVKDDSIVNADIKSDAAIALSKLASTPAVLTGSTNNQITTVTAANAIQGEANLTFDGSTLGVTGDVTLTNTSSNPQLALIAAADGTAEIQFGDANDAVRGNILYKAGSGGDAICFNGYNNTERLRISSAGKVGINCTSPTQLLEINGSSNPCVLVKDTTNDCISYVYSQDSVATFGSASNHDVVFNVNNGEKARILTGGGITFNGDTAAANGLSDYEEGDWTFNVYSGTINNDGTTSGRVCKYRKVGGTVHFWFDFFQTNNNMELVGTVVISGFPFTPETDFHAHMNISTYNSDGSGTSLTNYMDNNGRLVFHGNGTVSNIRHLWGFGSYPVSN